MLEPGDVERRIRVGVFDTVIEADVAIEELLEAGFRKNQISVICSDEAKRKHFDAAEITSTVGKPATDGVATGGKVGALVGGAMAFTGLTTMSGGVVFVAGPLLLAAGAVVGSLIGAMQARGASKEAANYYDQAANKGKILVAVEDLGDHRPSQLQEVERIFASAGSIPVPLPVG
jgi:hypothetical protein